MMPLKRRSGARVIHIYRRVDAGPSNSAVERPADAPALAAAAHRQRSEDIAQGSCGPTEPESAIIGERETKRDGAQHHRPNEAHSTPAYLSR